MSNAKLILVLIVLLVIVGGYFLLQEKPQPQETADREGQNTQESSSFVPVPGNEEIQENIIEVGPVVTLSASGFSPALITVKSGQAVLFTNESSADFWPASAVHPTHQVYPGSDIQKCFSGQPEVIFDACRPLSPGSSWPFVFTQKGSWKYHDHLNPGFTGTVVVE